MSSGGLCASSQQPKNAVYEMSSNAHEPFWVGTEMQEAEFFSYQLLLLNRRITEKALTSSIC